MNLTSNIHLFVENREGYLLPFLYLEYNLSINNINKDYEKSLIEILVIFHSLFTMEE